MNKTLQFLKANERLFITILIIFGLLYFLFHSIYGTGWKYAAAYSYALFGIFIVWAFVSKNDLLKKVLVFGIVAGFVELISDWWLVSYQEVLVYYPDEPIIVSSPLYMPFSWAVIFVQIGYLSWLVYQKFKFSTAVITATILGASFVPFFEYMAKDANWWYYQDCNMIGAVPYFIIASEAAICALLPFFFKRMEKSNYFFVVIYGIMMGLWIWIAAMIAFYIFR